MVTCRYHHIDLGTSAYTLPRRTARIAAYSAYEARKMPSLFSHARSELRHTCLCSVPRLPRRRLPRRILLRLQHLALPFSTFGAFLADMEDTRVSDQSDFVNNSLSLSSVRKSCRSFYTGRRALSFRRTYRSFVLFLSLSL